MDRAGYWNLIQMMCEEAGDDTITALRIPLLNFFAIDEQCFATRNVRRLAECLQSLLPTAGSARIPPVQFQLPLLLFPYATGSNLLNLLPVAREARHRGLLGGIVTGEGHIVEVEGFAPVISTKTLRTLAGARYFPGILRSVRKSWSRLIAVARKYDVKSASRIQRNFGWILRLMIESERMGIAFRKLLAEWRPSCIVSTSDYWPVEYQLFCQAKRAGIPNAMIQHGEFTDVVSWPAYADTFLVWGELYRGMLQDLGAPANRLRVCGMPAGDELFNRLQDTKPRPITANPVCVVLSSTQDRLDDPSLVNEFVAYLKHALHTIPGVLWKIKLHPAEDDSYYRETGLLDHERVEVLPKSVSLETAIENADVACTIRSTAGLQSMMMQRPLIILDIPTRYGCPVSWARHGGGISAKTADEFKRHLDRLITDDNFRASLMESQHKFLEMTFANRGRAAACIVDYMEEHTRATCPLS